MPTKIAVLFSSVMVTGPPESPPHTVCHTPTTLRSTSSTSSEKSTVALKEAETESIASTSELKEVELQPILEQTKHVRFTSGVSLNEAPLSTSVITDQINPTRDGVYAHVRNAIRRYDAITATGSGIATGGLVANSLNQHNNNLNQSFNSTITSNQLIDDGVDINNPL